MGDATSFTVVLGITGSIAAYKAADLIRQLRAVRDPLCPQRRIDVRVILTKYGAEFITPVTLQTVSGNAVYQELFQSAQQWDVQHIGLADDADVLLIAPVSANMMAKIVTGICDDLLSTVAMACTAPLLLAPAMNVHMWEHAATQANYQTLQARGVEFIGPAAGALACGYEGQGRLAPLSEIVAAVTRYFLSAQPNRDLLGRTVLVTAGPTREFLDPVRFISNPSSGKMGYALARAAQQRGAEVTLVSGPVTIAPPAGITFIPVISTAEMQDAVMAAALNADIIIGAAAPVDFTPTERAPQKMKKSGRTHETLEFLPTPDILAEVGVQKRPGQIIVAFAAESERLEAQARDKMSRKHADLIIANDITAPDAGFASDTNRALLLYADGRKSELPLQSKESMANRILDAVVAVLKD